MIRVLQVLGSLDAGGAETRMMEVYRHLDRERYAYDFLVFREAPQHYETEIMQLGGRIYKCKTPKLNNMLNIAKEIYNILKNGQYDAVQAHTSYFSGVVMAVARLAGVPVRITHARTTNTVRKGKLKQIDTFLGKQLISRCTTTRIAISQDAGNYLFGKQEFEVIPNAIDIEKYQNIDLERIKEIKREYNIPENAYVIGQIGRFNPMKNHMFTLRWFKQYCQEHEDAYLLFVGDGYMRPKIENMAKKLSIRIRFTGVIDNVYELLHIIDVHFFPSLFEGLGGVVLEAQAAGIPTVMSSTLPRETDMGLGLIQRCALDADYDTWSNAVEYCRKIGHPSQDIIKKAFLDNRYSMEYELERLCSIYCGDR